jgi:N-methylhydantoinase B/oxoprolinase/acetone carboxylase alpha subunit
VQANTLRHFERPPPQAYRSSQATAPVRADGPGKAEGLQEGDSLVTNHPVAAGGSHLPDITVITPVWDSGNIVFFVASRGHHADVGGTSPGSMPPHSKTLVEEGAMITSFKLVSHGQFQVTHRAALCLS